MSITVSGDTQNDGIDVYFGAGDFILLESGFTAEGDFTAEINPCGENCDNQIDDDGDGLIDCDDVECNCAVLFSTNNIEDKRVSEGNKSALTAPLQRNGVKDRMERK